MKVAVPDLISNSYFPAIAAIELGFFAKQGLDASLAHIFPSFKAFEALRDGDVDFVAGPAHGALFAFPGMQGGKFLAALAQGTYWMLVMRSDLAPKHGHLSIVEGKRIAAVPVVELGLRLLLAEAGIDAESAGVQIVPVPRADEPGVSSGVAAARALAEGTIDGFWANATGAEVAVRRGVGTIVLDVRRGNGPPPCFHYTFPAFATADRVIGQQTVYKRFDNWKSGPLPAMERVIVREVPSPSTRRALVVRGDVDVSLALPPKDTAELQAAGKLTVVGTPIENCMHALGLNLKFKPFQDKRVRQAVAYALPYDKIFKAAAYERGVPMWGGKSFTPKDISWPQPFRPVSADRLSRHRRSLYPFELSGGMCQRIMIAIALACEPALLIADEPTTGLDVTTQKTIMDLIHDLATDREMACMLITHDLGLAAQYCDRIVVMEKGRVVEAAATRALFSQPTHPYTKKLIRATPRPDSTLEDFAVIGEAEDGEEIAPESPPAELPRVGITETPLLHVADLVKEFPIRQKEALNWRRLLRLKSAIGEEEAPTAFRAVDGISFDVMPGESIGLVGESGCGKSTTSRLVTRLLDATSGVIEFEGQALHDIPAWGFARRPERSLIQMVFQDPTESLNPRYSAFDAIADPLRQLGGEYVQANPGEQVERLARMVGLPANLLTRYPHQLSGGQKARVGIARAIALEPRLLVLDEPTSALDVSVQAVILRLLDQLRRRLGLSYIFVSHDLNVVRLLCDRVIVMNRGRIVEHGDATELLNNPKQSYTRSLVEAIPHFRPDMREAS